MTAAATPTTAGSISGRTRHRDEPLHQRRRQAGEPTLIEEAAVIGRILRHLGVPTDLPVARPARGPPLLAAAGEVQADPYDPVP